MGVCLCMCMGVVVGMDNMGDVVRYWGLFRFFVPDLELFPPVGFCVG